ncbi:IS200/IS605 family transposase [Candidatus Babeliales bacterium]|nr:IS200/IS605 family transposase [Candidatus Babeliales bacterium]
MSNHTYSSMFYHIIWSTKNRKPYIKCEFKSKLYDFIGKIIVTKEWIPLAINGTSDHIHVLFQLFPNYKVSDVVCCIKANSSRFMRDNFISEFLWQGGYSVFTVDKKLLPKIKNYIAKQEQHHAVLTFEDELMLLLKRNRISYGDYFKRKLL